MPSNTDDSTEKPQMSPNIQDPVHGQGASASIDYSMDASAEGVSPKLQSNQPPEPPPSRAEATNTKIPVLSGGEANKQTLEGSMHAAKALQQPRSGLQSSRPPPEGNPRNKKGAAMSGIPVKGKFGLGDSIYANTKQQQPKTPDRSPTSTKVPKKNVAAVSEIPVKGKGLSDSSYANNKTQHPHSNLSPDLRSSHANVPVPQVAAQSGAQVKRRNLLGDSQWASSKQKSQQSGQSSMPVDPSPQASPSNVQTVTPSVGSQVKQDRPLGDPAHTPRTEQMSQIEPSPAPAPPKTPQTDSSSAQVVATPGGQKKKGGLMGGGSIWESKNKEPKQLKSSPVPAPPNTPQTDSSSAQVAATPGGQKKKGGLMGDSMWDPKNNEPKQPESSSTSVTVPSQTNPSNTPVTAVTNGQKKKEGRKGKPKQEPAALEETQQRQSSPASLPPSSEADALETKIVAVPDDQKTKGGLLEPKSRFEPSVVEKLQSPPPSPAPIPELAEVVSHSHTAATRDGQKKKGGLLGPKSRFEPSVAEKLQSPQPSPASIPAPAEVESLTTPTTTTHDGQKKKGGLIGPKSRFEPSVAEKLQSPQSSPAPVPAPSEVESLTTPTTATHNGQENEGPSDNKESQEPQSSPSIALPAPSAFPLNAPDSKLLAEPEPKVDPTVPAEHADSSKHTPDPQPASSVATPRPAPTLSAAQGVKPADEQEQKVPLMDPSVHAGSAEKLPGHQSDQPSGPSSSTVVSSGVESDAPSDESEREKLLSAKSIAAVPVEKSQVPQSMPSLASELQPISNDSVPQEPLPGLDASDLEPSSQQMQQSGVSTPSQPSGSEPTAKEAKISQERPSSHEARKHALESPGSQQPPASSQPSIQPPSLAGSPNSLPPGTPTGPKNEISMPHRGNPNLLPPGTPNGPRINPNRQVNSQSGARRGPAAMKGNNEASVTSGNRSGYKNWAPHPKPTLPPSAAAELFSQRPQEGFASPQTPMATNSTGHTLATHPLGAATGTASGTLQPALDSPQTPTTASSATQPQAHGLSEASRGDRALTEVQPLPASGISGGPASPALVSTSAVPGSSVPLQSNTAGSERPRRNPNSVRYHGGRSTYQRAYGRFTSRVRSSRSRNYPPRRRKVKAPAPAVLPKAQQPATATDDPEDLIRLTRLRLALAPHPVRQFPIETQMVVRDMEGRKQMPEALEMQLAEFWNIKDWDEKDENGYHVWLGHPGIPIVAGPPQAWKGKIWKVHKTIYKQRMDDLSIRHQAWNFVMKEGRTGNPQVKVMEDKLQKLMTITPKQRGEEKAELIAKVERLEKQLTAASEAESVTGVRTATDDTSFSTFTKHEIGANKEKRIARLEKDLAASQADGKLKAKTLVAKDEDIKSKETALQASRIEAKSKDELIQELKIKNKEHEQALSTQKEALLKTQLQLQGQITQHEKKVRELSDEKNAERQAKEGLAQRCDDLAEQTAKLDKRLQESMQAHLNSVETLERQLKQEKTAHAKSKSSAEDKLKQGEKTWRESIKNANEKLDKANAAHNSNLAAEKRAHERSTEVAQNDREKAVADIRKEVSKLKLELTEANTSNDRTHDESRKLREDIDDLKAKLKDMTIARAQDLRTVDYVLKQVDDSEAAQLKPLSGKMSIINVKIEELKKKADQNKAMREQELKSLRDQLANSKTLLEVMDKKIAEEVLKAAGFKAEIQQAEERHNVTKKQLKTVEQLAEQYANRLKSIHNSLVVYIESIVDFLPADGQSIEGNTEELIAHLQWMYESVQRELEDSHKQLLECQNKLKDLEKDYIITSPTSPSLDRDLERHQWDYAFDNDGDNAGDHEGDGHADDDDNRSDHTAMAPCKCPCTCKASNKLTVGEEPAEDVPHHTEIGTQIDDIIAEDSEKGTQADDSDSEGPAMGTQTDDAAADNATNSSLPSPTVTYFSVYSGIDTQTTIPEKKSVVDSSTQTMPILEEGPVEEIIRFEPAVAAEPVRSLNWNLLDVICGVLVLGMVTTWLTTWWDLLAERKLWHAANADTLAMLWRQSQKTVLPPPLTIGAGLMASVHATLDWIGMPP